MKTILKFVFPIVATLSLAGCGDKATQSGTVEEVTIGKTTFVRSSAGLLAKVGLTRTENNFHLTATIEDGGSLSLVAYSDEKLERGVTVTFSRAGNVITVKTPVKELAQYNVAVGTDVIARVDLHNDENGKACVVVWNSETISEDNEVAHDHEAADKGQSDKWGFITNKATLKAADVTEAEDQH